MTDMLKKGVPMAVGILVFGLIVAYTLPTVMTPMNEPRESTFNQTVDQTITVTGPLDSTVTNVDDTGDTVSLTLNDTDTGSTETVSTLSTGSNTTVSMPDGDVTVTHNSVTSTNSSGIAYEYDDDYGWDNGSSALFNLLPIFFVLGLFLFLVRKLT